MTVVVQRGVCLAFDAATLDESPVWTSLYDIDGVRVQAWSTDRGRAFEFDQSQPGTVTVAVFDYDGVLDATNAFSPYAGKINPLMQIAVFLTNPLTGDESSVFRGFVENIETTMDVSKKFMIHTITGVDGFETVGNAEVIPDGTTGKATYAAGAVDTRIGGALTDAGWPLGLRRIFSGNVNLQETVYEPGDKILTVVFDAADAEFPGVANVYVDKEGNFTFHGRLARFDPTNPDYDINSWKAGDGEAGDLDSTVAVVSGLQFDRAKAHIYNSVLVTPQNMPVADTAGQIVTDTPSVDAFGVRSDSHLDLVVAGGETDGLDANEEAALYATYEVDNYKEPRTRVNELQFRIPRDGSPNLAAWWDMICRVDISDVVLLQTSHIGGGGFNENFFVEGVHVSAKPLRDTYPELDVTLDLSPAAYYSSNPFG
jgi:hypothetical protein